MSNKNKYYLNCIYSNQIVHLDREKYQISVMMLYYIFFINLKSYHLWNTWKSGIFDKFWFIIKYFKAKFATHYAHFYLALIFYTTHVIINEKMWKICIKKLEYFKQKIWTNEKFFIQNERKELNQIVLGKEVFVSVNKHLCLTEA